MLNAWLRCGCIARACSKPELNTYVTMYRELDTEEDSALARSPVQALPTMLAQCYTTELVVHK